MALDYTSHEFGIEIGSIPKPQKANRSKMQVFEFRFEALLSAVCLTMRTKP